MDEQQRRLYAGLESFKQGHGGDRQLAERLGLDAATVARGRAWKCALQEQLVDRFDLEVTVCHYPTGASKWNPIEHRLFGEISKHWAGQPLDS